MDDIDDMEEYEFEDEDDVYEQALEAMSDGETYCCIIPCVDPEGDESLAVVWQEVASYYEVGDTEMLFIPQENCDFFDDNARVRATAIIMKTMKMRKALEEKGYRLK